MTRRTASLLFLAALLALSVPVLGGDAEAPAAGCPFAGKADDAAMHGCPFAGTQDTAEAGAGCPFTGDRDVADARPGCPFDRDAGEVERDVAKVCPFGRDEAPTVEAEGKCPYLEGTVDRFDPVRERNKV